MANVTVLLGINPATGTNDSGRGAPHESTQYSVLVLVPVFFLLGLLGVFVCHILKKKGYRCTTEAEDIQALEAKKNLEEAAELNDTFSDGNNDTVGHIINYIMKNEANSDALKAMLQESSADPDGPTTPTTPTSPVPPATPQSPESPGAPKHTCSHLHTIGGVAGHRNICSRCSQKKWPLIRQSRRNRADCRSHAAEVTVLAVGRFRVTKCDPKSPRDRRTLLITETKGSVPASPTASEPKSRTASESQEKTQK